MVPGLDVLCPVVIPFTLKIISLSAGKKPELWDGKASERIVDIIKKKMVRI